MASSSPASSTASSTLRVRATSAVLRAMATARRPISAKSARTVGGHGPAALGVLGDVQREVAHPLQVTGGADRRHRGPQVARDRGVEEHRVGGDLLDPRAEGVDRRVAGDHLVRQAFPALQQRRGGALHGDRRGRRHVGEEQRQVGELARQRVGGTSTP